MPIYEYKCRQCGNKFEELVYSTATEDKIKCNECGSKETEKLMSACCSSVSGGSADFDGGRCAAGFG